MPGGAFIKLGLRLMDEEEFVSIADKKVLPLPTDPRRREHGSKEALEPIVAIR